MSERFSAVFVRFSKGDPNAKTYMFEAPYYADIEIGDTVKVQGWGAEPKVVAIERFNLGYNSDKDLFELLQQITGVTELPLQRVLAVLKIKELKYEEEESNG